MRTNLVSETKGFVRTTVLRHGVVGFCLSAVLMAMNPSLADAEGRSDYGAYVPQVVRGFVIVDGVYLPPPYQFELVGQELRINDSVLMSDDLDLAEFEAEEESVDFTRDIERGAKSRRSRQSQSIEPIDRLWDAARTTACMEGAVILAKGEQPLLLEHSRSAHELLVALLRNASSDSKHAIAFQPPVELESPESRQAWNRVIADFKPSQEFVERAGVYVSEILAANASSERIVRASLWADSISYPLTLFAMIVVVVAFGHLLSNKPRLEEEQAGLGASPATRRVVLRSLLIFGLLSAVDLVWTITANATGAMREMNPLGNGMINDPVRLIAFKVIAVTVTIVLLYSLHRRPIAQVASWWSCLVLTLLTARWLTFHSMFM